MGGCSGAPGLPLWNHTAPAFYGYRGEWPGQEAMGRADYSGFGGLECGQLVLTTAAPAPQGRLEFAVEVAPAPQPSTGAASSSRRRLHLQPLSSSAGQLAADGGASGGASVAAGPTLRLRLPPGQQLSSVIWKDGMNRTVLVQSGAELAAAAASSAGNDSWATGAVTLPPLLPLAASSAAPPLSCSGSGGACQPRYSVVLLAPDGRHARADITPLGGQQLSMRHKYYEASQLTYSQASLTMPLAAGDAKAVLVVPPAQQDTGSSTRAGSSGGSGDGGGKGGGVPMAMLGAATGGGAALVAAVIGGLLWCRARRRRRQQQQGEASVERISADSYSSSKK